VATCADCEEERLARESSGVLADADEEHIVALVRQDLLATLGPGFEEIAIEEAARLRLFAETPPEYEQRVVDDVQQRLMTNSRTPRGRRVHGIPIIPSGIREAGGYARATGPLPG
jgi:hypothetical protein